MLNLALATGVFAGSSLALWWAVTSGHAWIQIEKYVFAMSRIRDEIEVDVFTGRLPDVPSVQFLWAKASILGSNPRMVSLARMMAVVRHAPTLATAKQRVPAEDDLTVEQQERVNSYERQIIKLMVRRLTFGSKFWIIMPFAYPILRIIARAHEAPPAPQETVERYNDVLNASSEPGPDGTPQVAAALLPPRQQPRAKRPHRHRELVAP